MVEIRINIEKKHLWIFAILCVLFGGVGYVIGYGTIDPAVFGHTAGELQGARAGDPDTYGMIDGGLYITGEARIWPGNAVVLESTAFVIENTGSVGNAALGVLGDVNILAEAGQTDETVSIFIGDVAYGGWQIEFEESSGNLNFYSDGFTLEGWIDGDGFHNAP